MADEKTIAIAIGLSLKFIGQFLSHRDEMKLFQR
jgi:hypothetical protein